MLYWTITYKIFQAHAYPQTPCLFFLPQLFLALCLWQKRATVSAGTSKIGPVFMMGLHFTKMQALGNDCMVIDGVRQSVSLQSEQIKALARRDTGVGFDQCLLIEASCLPEVDFLYRIFNADGSEVGQCGNGARCLGRFLVHAGLTDKTQIRVATKTTTMDIQLLEAGLVRVSLAKPEFAPKAIPILAAAESEYYPLRLANGSTWSVQALSVGNPHAVSLLSNIADLDLATLGKEISEHSAFPLQTNAGFMQIINPETIALRVYERGAGETTACGSGAVAAVAIGRRFHGLAASVEVRLPGGNLQVDWPDLAGPIYLAGPAHFVYEGHLLELQE